MLQIGNKSVFFLGQPYNKNSLKYNNFGILPLGCVRKVLLWITFFIFLLVNNVIQKISSYELIIFFIILLFQASLKFLTFQKYLKKKKINFKIKKVSSITKLKQMRNKRALVNLYKDIVLVTCVCIFCTTLFTNNNIKIVIQSSTFITHLALETTFDLSLLKT